MNTVDTGDAARGLPWGSAPSRTCRRPQMATLLLLLCCACGGDSTVDGGPSAGGRPDAAPVDADPAPGTPDAGTHTIGDLGPGLSTLVGHSSAGFVDGDRNTSLFNNPVNAVMGPNGNIYVADFDNGAIREVTPAGETTTLVQQAGFSRPFGMDFTPSGTFYVQTDYNSSGALMGALWQVELDTGAATLVLDNAGRARGLASLSDGRLVLSDMTAHTLRIYDPELGLMSHLAGRASSPGFADGTGIQARFDRPIGVAVTSDDGIYVADSANHRIRHVTLAGAVTTVAGTGSQSSVDGSVDAASFDTPVGLALDGDTTLFVSEFDSGLIRRVSDGAVATIAGSTPGYADNVEPLLGQLSACEGMAFDSPYLYLADGNAGTDAPYHRVRRLEVEDD